MLDETILPTKTTKAWTDDDLEKAVQKLTVYLLSIYDKSEKDNLTDKEINELLKYIP